MLTFDEIENCMPDGACSDPSTGEIRVSSQWLHDYAHAVAQAEREACARFIEHCDRGTVEFSACKALAAAIRQPPSERHNAIEIRWSTSTRDRRDDNHARCS